ncbi:MAG: DUF1214 domain-containing protein [Acidimicrobiales bacterium]|nr:DUF1214 domain-containing protein [Acidimicrobiales bacterium]
MTSDLAPQARAAYDDLIETLTTIRDDYLGSERRFDDPLDVVEGYRYVGQILGVASELLIEADPDHPRLASMASPARKLQGDNPDALYHHARISGDRSYRIFGSIGQAIYTSFTVHARDENGAIAGAVLADVNDRDFDVDPDGRYEVVLSATEADGNWIELAPDAHCVIVRSYFELETSVQNQPAIEVAIDIECLDDVGPPPPLSDEALANRMREGVALLRHNTLGQRIPGEGPTGPFAAEGPNDVAKPFSFRASGMDVPGAVDLFYSTGRFDLAPDEALVMTGRLPKGDFANVMLWNRHMQTLEYRNRSSSLNGAQMKLDEDRRFRIVISQQDPGVPNWLDTAGHRTGTIFWRFLLPEEDPEKPVCEVVPLADIRESAANAS